MKVYAHPRCTTCKKALAWLEARGIAHTVVDITATPPTRRELAAMLAAQSGDVRRLFNTSGMDYRAQGLKDKLPGMTEDEALDLLAGNGMLVRRPFVLGDGVALAGFREKAWAEVLG